MPTGRCFRTLVCVSICHQSVGAVSHASQQAPAFLLLFTTNPASVFLTGTPGAIRRSGCAELHSIHRTLLSGLEGQQS